MISKAVHNILVGTIVLLALHSEAYALEYEKITVEGISYHGPKTGVEGADISDHYVHQPWRDVQESVRNTVVQVFSQIAELDFLQPYRTPTQYPVRGTGFFINCDGYLVTNAHVVDQAVAVWVQVPSLGKHLLKAEIVGVYPDKDLALLCLDPKACKLMNYALGSIPFLPLGNSDEVRRADEALALGYPLGQEALKSTNGIISGREHIRGLNLIQTDTPINPGSSGGPLINIRGEVIGINSCGIEAAQAQNVNYAITCNDLKMALSSLFNNRVSRKPFLGVLTVKATQALTEYLKNPEPGGCYVVEVINDSPLQKAGVQRGDMIYEINGHEIDIYGEMFLPYREDPVSITDYVSSLETGAPVHLVVYRNGERLEFDMCTQCNEITPVNKIYPWHEEIEYEVFAGMVVMPLTTDHIRILGSQASGLLRYAIPNFVTEPALVITHVFPNSEMAASRAVSVGFTVRELNGMHVTNLEEFRVAMKESVASEYVTLRVADEVSLSTENIPVVLPLEPILHEVAQLSNMYHYPISASVQEVIEAYEEKKQAEALEDSMDNKETELVVL